MCTIIMMLLPRGLLTQKPLNCTERYFLLAHASGKVDRLISAEGTQDRTLKNENSNHTMHSEIDTKIISFKGLKAVTLEEETDLEMGSYHQVLLGGFDSSSRVYC